MTDQDAKATYQAINRLRIERICKEHNVKPVFRPDGYVEIHFNLGFSPSPESLADMKLVGRMIFEGTSSG
jgi:hypothetical protein